MRHGVDCSGEVGGCEEKRSPINDVVRDVAGELKKGGSGGSCWSGMTWMRDALSRIWERMRSLDMGR
jgi:hypothetical protein